MISTSPPLFGACAICGFPFDQLVECPNPHHRWVAIHGEWAGDAIDRILAHTPTDKNIWAACRDLLSGGFDITTVREMLERRRVNLAKQDEVLIDALDCLANWCAPGRSLAAVRRPQGEKP